MCACSLFSVLCSLFSVLCSLFSVLCHLVICLCRKFDVPVSERTAIDPVFARKNTEKPNQVEVDLVTDYGMRWIKVKAMSPRRLQASFDGLLGSSTNDLNSLSQDLLAAADTNVCHFQPPTVILVCLYGVPQDVADELEDWGMHVTGTRLSEQELAERVDTSVKGAPLSSILQPDLLDFCLPEPLDETKIGTDTVNVDSSTMITMVSDLTNGYASEEFEQADLNSMRQVEIDDPTLPKIEAILKGRKLVACSTAIQRFRDIVKSIGGEREAKRAEVLLARITEVKDW
jgi:Protein of unknown function (DUF1308)